MDGPISYGMCPACSAAFTRQMDRDWPRHDWDDAIDAEKADEIVTTPAGT